MKIKFVLQILIKLFNCCLQDIDSKQSKLNEIFIVNSPTIQPGWEMEIFGMFQNDLRIDYWGGGWSYFQGKQYLNGKR